MSIPANKVGKILVAIAMIYIAIVSKLNPSVIVYSLQNRKTFENRNPPIIPPIPIIIMTNEPELVSP